MSTRPRPMALIILDGWGYSEKVEYNSILAANTPVWDKLWERYPHTLIRTSGAGPIRSSNAGFLGSCPLWWTI